MFFEECIKEEQFEAKKLDIMRDAVRAKATYTIETKHMKESGCGSSEGESLPTSPREMSPLPPPPATTTTDEVNGKMENGSATADDQLTNGTVANGDGGSGEVEVVTNGNGTHTESTSWT